MDSFSNFMPSVQRRRRPTPRTLVYIFIVALVCVRQSVLSVLTIRGGQGVQHSFLDQMLEMIATRDMPSGSLTSLAQHHQSDLPSSSSGDILPSTTTTTTVHVLYGLHGNHTGFLDQWEVNLKSTILNAPLDYPLHVHILANSPAEYAVRQRLQEAQLLLSNNSTASHFRQPIHLTIYNVEKYHKQWYALLRSKFRGKDLDRAYPMGVYYRLLASQVILPYWQHKQQNEAFIADITAILYMDADVVVLSNLNDLWRNVKVEPEEGHDDPAAATKNQTTLPVLYQWSATWPNSGFVVYFLQHMHFLWDLLDQLPEIRHTNDQSLLVQVANAFPEVAGTLPKEWDTHMGHGWRDKPHSLFHQQERVGMAHFTGKPPTGQSYLDKNGVAKYCMRSKLCQGSGQNREEFMKTWGLVDYYIRIPWHYVRYLGSSQVPIGQVGYPLEIEFVH